MKISRHERKKVKVEIEGEQLEHVKTFKYLGGIITDDKKCETHIKSIIAIAKEAFNKKKGVTDKNNK